MKTKDNLHNLHFIDPVTFPDHAEFKDRKLVTRQITYETHGCPHVFFDVDEKTLDLFVDFSSDFGTKEKLLLINAGKLPNLHVDAIDYLAKVEMKIIKLLMVTDLHAWHDLDKSGKFEETVLKSLSEK